MGTGDWLADGLDPTPRVHFLASGIWLLASGFWSLVLGSWIRLYDAPPDWCNTPLAPGTPVYDVIAVQR